MLQEKERDFLVGKFVVPNKEDDEEGWFFGPVIDKDKGQYLIFLLAESRIVRKPEQEVRDTFAFFEDEEAARAYFRQKKSAKVELAAL